MTTSTMKTGTNNRQQYVILNALALYDSNINSINGSIASESIMASNTKENGKPTAEAIRAMCRIASATERLEQLTAERDAFIAQFGIII